MPDLFNTSVVAEVDTSTSFLDINLKAKEILPQISWVVTQRKIEYIPDLINLSKHTSVAVKRKVAEGLGIIGQITDTELIKTWIEQESDRQTWLTLQASIDSLQRKTGETSNEIEKLTVLEAVTLVKKILGDKTYIIEGELTEIKPIKNMFAFGVKDKDARLNCWMLASVSERKSIPMNEGLTVRLKGKFKLSKESRLYFNVEELNLTGEGELLRNLKILEARLREEGLFEIDRKRKIPELPEKILLLASPNSAAIDDFLKVLSARRKGLEIYHLPIKTQGVGAESELLNALEIANNLNSTLKIDTVVITRGGGSNDDLAVFNSERVVRAIYALNRPSIVAIGHERDFTLSEYVADLRASTPSNAAELVSLSSNQIISQSDFLVQEINNNISTKISSYSDFSRRISDNIFNIIRSNIAEFRLNLGSFDLTIQNLINEVKSLNQNIYQSILNLIVLGLNQAKLNLTDLKVVETDLQNQIQQYKKLTLNYLESIMEIGKSNLQNYKYQFNLCVLDIQQYDVNLVLEKGFALVTQNGKVIESKSELNQQSITITFKDGEVER